MRRIIIVTTLLILTGCEEIEEEMIPEMPVPIFPSGELDYQTQDDSLLFVWGSLGDANRYAIEIASDDSCSDLIYDRVIVGEDTSCLVPADMIYTDSNYYWRVAAFIMDEWTRWSESFEFSYYLLSLDLDTTYYPYGLGYKWSYVRHSWKHSNMDYWDRYDTSTALVTDSFWIYDTLVFEINSSGHVKFWKYKVNGADLYPEPDTTPIEGGEYRIYYVGDSLLIKEEYAEAPESWPPDIWHKWEHRLKGVGHISSGSYWSGHGDYSEGSSTGLLYFYNGEDTVYKAD